jgi:hypothetical protein
MLNKKPPKTGLRDRRQSKLIPIAGGDDFFQVLKAPANATAKKTMLAIRPAGRVV